MDIEGILDNVEKFKPLIADHAGWSEEKGQLHLQPIDALTRNRSSQILSALRAWGLRDYTNRMCPSYGGDSRYRCKRGVVCHGF